MSFFDSLKRAFIGYGEKQAEKSYKKQEDKYLKKGTYHKYGYRWGQIS